MVGKFWDRWSGLIQRLVASLGSQASLLGLVYFFASQSPPGSPPFKLEGWLLLLSVVAAALAALSVWLE